MTGVQTCALPICEKRPVSQDALDRIVVRIESDLKSKSKSEIKSRQVGELVMKELKGLDEVAYIRFASVYRKFGSITSFEKELKILKQGGE